MAPLSGAPLAGAFLVDMALAEPPERWHPVCWMGSAIEMVSRPVLKADAGPRFQHLAGAAIAVALPAGTWFMARSAMGLLPRRAATVSALALLTSALAGRALYAAAMEVREGLELGVDEGRRRVAAMVGRDVEGMDEQEVIRAAIESVAENANDGVIAPLFYGLLGGAPLALAYRMVNTLDSMIGYRQGPYAHLGWAAARLDDLAGFLPARLTAAAAAVMSPLAGGSPAGALKAWRREAGGHASPNAGVCEAAFAGALGVRLGGVNRYSGTSVAGPVLGEGSPPPDRDDIGRAALLMYTASALILVVGLLARALAAGGGRDD
jgi:adenosylcobinamide-phosphate synthase